MPWERITSMLPAAGDPTDCGKLRSCLNCGRLVDHAADHRTDCLHHATVPVDGRTTVPGKTNLEYFKALAARMRLDGCLVEVKRRGRSCWVERRL